MDLIELLLSDEGYATGKKTVPVSVSKDDAIAIAGLMQREVDRGAAAREEAAAQQGVHSLGGAGGLVAGDVRGVRVVPEQRGPLGPPPDDLEQDRPIVVRAVSSAPRP